MNDRGGGETSSYYRTFRVRSGVGGKKTTMDILLETWAESSTAVPSAASSRTASSMSEEETGKKTTVAFHDRMESDRAITSPPTAANDSSIKTLIGFVRW